MGNLLETKLYRRSLIKHLDFSPCKIPGTILDVDVGRSSTNGRENKKTNDDE